MINQAEFSPPVFEEGVLAEHQLRRKSSAPRKRPAIEEESDEDLELLFPAGGPTNRRATDDPDRPKKTRRRRQRSQEPDDEELAERARKRREREREKARRIKSDVYVHASDDDSDSEKDAEFFAREAEQRLRSQKAAEVVGQGIPGLVVVPNLKKRKADIILSDDSSEGEDEDMDLSQKTRSSAGRDRDASDGEEMDDTPPSSSPQSSRGRKRRRLSLDETGDTSDLAGGESDTEVVEVAGNVEMGQTTKQTGADEDEDMPVAKVRARPRAKAGFIIDSSDEE
jgi:replication fork protection complex subunit Tof1/Swi1